MLSFRCKLLCFLGIKTPMKHVNLSSFMLHVYKTFLILSTSVIIIFFFCNLNNSHHIHDTTLLT
jgi:hypothetical protein